VAICEAEKVASMESIWLIVETNSFTLIEASQSPIWETGDNLKVVSDKFSTLSWGVWVTRGRIHNTSFSS